MLLFACMQDIPDVGPYILFRAQLLCYDLLAVNLRLVWVYSKELWTIMEDFEPIVELCINCTV